MAQTSTTQMMTTTTKNRDTTAFKQKNYVPKHPQIYTFDEQFLDPIFLQTYKDAVEIKPLMVQVVEMTKKHVSCDGFQGNEEEHQAFHKMFYDFNMKRRQIIANLMELELQDVYSLPLFTQQYCDLLIDEAKHFEKVCNVQLRPNSMNKFGLVIDEMGLGPFFDTFVLNYFNPIAALLNRNSFELDDHHTFIVEYALNKDKDLDVHVDDSELTINLCLGVAGFTGGNVFFKGHIEKPTTQTNYGEYEHVVGRAILHDGKHMHGALPLLSGERYNLIIWMRSSTYRKANQLPDYKSL